MKKLLSPLLGLLLVPLALATLIRLPKALLPLGGRLDSLFPILLGIVLYALFEALFSRPMRTYVFGHELTHALASLAIGGRVHSFHVSKQGGSVSLSKSNFFVALAPYCLPIYTLLIFLLYHLAGFWYPKERMHLPLLVLIGATLAFHASLTLYAIRQRQPDIHKTGVLFSLVFILWANSWCLMLIAKLLFREQILLWDFLKQTMLVQFHIWKWLYFNALAAAAWLRAHIQTTP